MGGTLHLLAGDIGGTKTDLAVYTIEDGPKQPIAQTTVRSADYPNLESAASDFVKSLAYGVDAAAFGVAGPVVDGKATGTNLPWSLDEEQLKKALALDRVTLLNDLQAIANAVPHLDAADLQTLNTGEPQDEGALAVIAPGTGLGEAFLTWEDGRYCPHPSEGGHSSFSPNSDLEIALLSYLRPKYGHVSAERVCSGRWMISLYEFLRDAGHATAPAWLEEKLAGADDPTPVLVAAGMEDTRSCEIARRTLELFVRILGAEAGNLALTVLATGGVYLAGGMPPRLLPLLQAPLFMEAFVDKGRLSYIVEQMPVHIVLESQAGLLGAAAYGLDHLTE